MSEPTVGDLVILSPEWGHIIQLFPRHTDDFWLRRFGTEQEALECVKHFTLKNGDRAGIENAIKSKVHITVVGIWYSPENLPAATLHHFERTR